MCSPGRGSAQRRLAMAWSDDAARFGLATVTGSSGAWACKQIDGNIPWLAHSNLDGDSHIFQANPVIWPLSMVGDQQYASLWHLVGLAKMANELMSWFVFCNRKVLFSLDAIYMPSAFTRFPWIRHLIIRQTLSIVVKVMIPCSVAETVTIPYDSAYLVLVGISENMFWFFS
jgi:hypothetical protein